MEDNWGNLLRGGAFYPLYSSIELAFHCQKLQITIDSP